jgi:hypothetical protein
VEEEGGQAKIILWIRLNVVWLLTVGSLGWKRFDDALVVARLYFANVGPYRGGKLTVVWEIHREGGRQMGTQTEYYTRD